jgi:hypothetical protein
MAAMASSASTFNSIRLLATNEVLCQSSSDPCPGTRKVLRVKYHEERVVTKLAEAWEDAEFWIVGISLTIEKAIYTDPKDEGRSLDVTNLVRDTMTSKAGKQGDFHTVRVSASNSLFSDPCPGRKKLLRVVYALENGANRTDETWENGEWAACGTELHILSATYGDPHDSSRSIEVSSIIKDRISKESATPDQVNELWQAFHPKAPPHHFFHLGAVEGAAVAAGIVGVVLIGPMTAVLVAGAAGYAAATRQDGVGELARKIGDTAAMALNEGENIVSDLSDRFQHNASN